MRPIMKYCVIVLLGLVMLSACGGSDSCTRRRRSSGLEWRLGASQPAGGGDCGRRGRPFFELCWF